MSEDDLPAFITARVDEDEHRATVEDYDLHLNWCAWGDLDRPAPCDCGNPARVLREVAAKRAMLGDENEGLAMIAVHERGAWPEELTREAGRLLRQLAAVYSNHPDYRPEWKP